MTAPDSYPRSDWPRLLSALPATQVQQAAQTLATDCAVEDLSLPNAGLGLLQLCDGALGDAYFLGEVPLARAHVRLTTGDGRSAEGAAQLLDDRAGLARAIAILDALLVERLPGAEQALALLHKGSEIRQTEARERRALLQATRVDFSLLGSGEEEMDDV